MLPVAILAGGLATRLRPLTETIPKSMIEISGQPFVHWQMKMLAKENVQQIVFCLAYKSEMISDYVGDGSQYGIKVQYSFDGEEQLGTGGAIRKSLPLLGDKFMVLYGDSYLPIDFNSVEKAFFRAKKPALMTIFFNEGRLDASNVAFSNGKIIRYGKGQISNDLKYVDYGLSCFESSAFPSVETHDPLDLGQICSGLANQSLLAGYEVKERFYEIGSFQGIRDFEEYIKENKNVL